MMQIIQSQNRCLFLVFHSAFSEVQFVTCSSEVPARALGTVTREHHPHFASFSVYSSYRTIHEIRFTDLIKKNKS